MTQSLITSVWKVVPKIDNDSSHKPGPARFHVPTRETFGLQNTVWLVQLVVLILFSGQWPDHLVALEFEVLGSDGGLRDQLPRWQEPHMGDLRKSDRLEFGWLGTRDYGRNLVTQCFLYHNPNGTPHPVKRTESSWLQNTTLTVFHKKVLTSHTIVDTHPRKRKKKWISDLVLSSWWNKWRDFCQAITSMDNFFSTSRRALTSFELLLISNFSHTGVCQTGWAVVQPQSYTHCQMSSHFQELTNHLCQPIIKCCEYAAKFCYIDWKAQRHMEHTFFQSTQFLRENVRS